MSLPWFKMYGSAFLVDTIRLSTEQKGAYLMLMLDYYDKEAPPPDDDVVLAQIAGLSLERWRVHRRSLEPFFIIDLGVWRHARCDEELVSRQTKIEANRENGKRPKRTKSQRKATGLPTGIATGSPNGYANGVPTEQANSEPDFGPSPPYEVMTSHSIDENGTDVPNDTQQEATGLPTGLATGIPNGLQSLDKKTLREGATAPSSASAFSIGSLIDPAFMPNAAACSLAGSEGVLDQIGLWLDDWRDRCTDAGTRNTDWQAAWGREYDRRMKERAKARPKPRVAVSKKPKTEKTEKRLLPPDWRALPEDRDFARTSGFDPDAIEAHFRDVWKAGAYKHADHDATFRNFIRKEKSEGKHHGQAQTTQRRAPSPRGSIVDAVAELDAEFARRGAGGAAAEDQPHGGATIYRLPQD
jgi:uncharacterized protein YdaU (DUF1376 family)